MNNIRREANLTKYAICYFLTTNVYVLLLITIYHLGCIRILF